MNDFLNDLRELATMPTLKGVLALLYTLFLHTIGYPGSAADSLVILMLCDLALGFGKAWQLNNVRGAKLKCGAFKFFRYWLAVAVFVEVDIAILKALPATPISISHCFIAYLATNEAFSCLDHLAFFGVPIPESFLSRLRQYRDHALAGKWDGEERRKTPRGE